MKKTKTILAISFLLMVFSASAQSEKLIKIQIERAIGSYFNTQGSEIFEKDLFKNSAFTFVIAISTDKNGSIDTILFSNKTALLDSIISFDNIAKMLKSKKIIQVFSTYKNTLFMSVVLLRKGWEHSIDNMEQFDSYFNKMMPDINGMGNFKKIHFLPAITMIQGRKQY